jgi:hypothetical protein
VRGSKRQGRAAGGVSPGLHKPPLFAARKLGDTGRAAQRTLDAREGEALSRCLRKGSLPDGRDYRRGELGAAQRRRANRARPAQPVRPSALRANTAMIAEGLEVFPLSG